MNSNNHNTGLDIQIDPRQNWIEPFNDLLNEIYYPGYAETLAEENPEAYNLEYNNFINLYDEPISADATI